MIHSSCCARLSRGYDVTWQRVASAEAMAEALAGKTWDVILADYTLPGSAVWKPCGW